jgi:large subunit ribosomal protein L15
MKGQGKRSPGRETPIWFEGGQMPLVRRVPKSGFKNIHRKPVAIVNVGSLAVFEEGSEIDVEALRGRGLVPRRPMPVKLLASGDAKSGLVVRVDRASAGARRKIEAAGGRVELVT